MRDCVLFFVKYPEPGMVKTRIADMSSPEAAADFYRVFVEEKLAELKAGCDADIIVCYYPESAGQVMCSWLGKGYRFLGQKGGDLGRRMENAFREAFFMGYDRAVLAGSDIPGLTCEIIGAALDGVDRDTASIGPAEDGGYYIIGFHRSGFVPEVFRKVEWSAGDVFSNTVDRLEEAGRRCAGLPQLDDLDTIEDVEEHVALGTAGPLSGQALVMARKLVGM